MLRLLAAVPSAAAAAAAFTYVASADSSVESTTVRRCEEEGEAQLQQKEIYRRGDTEKGQSLHMLYQQRPWEILAAAVAPPPQNAVAFERKEDAENICSSPTQVTTSGEHSL